MKVAAAETKLRAVLAAPPYDKGEYLWGRAQWRKLYALLSAIPPGVNAKLLGKVLDVVCEKDPIRQLEKLPAHLDDKILAMLEAREAKDVNCAFVAGAMRAARRDRPKKLRAFMAMTDTLHWGDRAKAAEIRKLIKKHPEIIDGAQAACAVEVDITSRYLPILAVDASPGSLDVLLPYLEAGRTSATVELDWILEDIVPLFPKTPQTQAWIASLEEAATARTESSPAKAWVQALGSRVPEIVKLTITFRNQGKFVFGLRVDSTEADWFAGRPHAKHFWMYQNPDQVAERVRGATDYILRIGPGLDRAKIDAWAQALLK
jgi:hypothetical protein